MFFLVLLFFFGFLDVFLVFLVFSMFFCFFGFLEVFLFFFVFSRFFCVAAASGFSPPPLKSGTSVLLLQG